MAREVFDNCLLLIDQLASSSNHLDLTGRFRDVHWLKKCFDVDGGHTPCAVDSFIVFMNLISRVIAVSVVAIFVLSAFAGLFDTLLFSR